jgi:DNA-binding NarL/FixJ family response regulator
MTVARPDQRRAANTDGRPALTAVAGKHAIVADDHPLVRRGLVLVLEGLGVTTQASVDSGDAVLAAAGEHHPDLAIVDMSMPGGGLALVERLHRDHPKTAILVYSTFAEKDVALACFIAGASGYAWKAGPEGELETAIDRLLAGRRYMSLAVSEQLADRLSGTGDAAAPPHESLSKRELQVFDYLARGLSLAEAAAHLGVSPNTVSTYRSRVLGKLGLTRDAELVRYAVRHGLIEA